MSNLYRNAMSARLAKLPHPNHIDTANSNDDDWEGEVEEAEDSVGSLPGSGLGPPAMPARNPRQRKTRTPNLNFSPISAAGYFNDAVQVSVPQRDLDFRVYYTPPKYVDGTVMVCHHGAGYTGLSFACFAKEVTAMTKEECGVLAFDARRHGKTTSTSNDENLSINVLVEDFIALLQVLFPDPTTSSSTFLLVGHSMGGSVVVQSCPQLQEAKYRIGGVAVLDVVEGSAIEALPYMNNLLNARPNGFDSIEEAIEWHVTTNTIHNPNSARVSIPSVFKQDDESASPRYQWRTPLRSTAPYWSSWFTGLSSKFLAARTARLLVLAGTDRLDKELMIGQMQGKFQQVVIPGVGHMLHEDNPTQLAEVLVGFWKRNERVVPGVKKVGEQ